MAFAKVSAEEPLAGFECILGFLNAAKLIIKSHAKENKPNVHIALHKDIRINFPFFYFQPPGVILKNKLLVVKIVSLLQRKKM